MFIYAFFDVKAGSLITPFFTMPNDAVAKRSLPDVLPRDFAPVKYSTDFQLYSIGLVDLQQVELMPEKRFIMNCNELFAAAEKTKV